MIDNAFIATPTEQTSCISKLCNFADYSSEEKSTFRRYCGAIRLIFDEVNSFTPKVIDEEYAYLLKYISGSEKLRNRFRPISIEKAVSYVQKEHSIKTRVKAEASVTQKLLLKRYKKESKVIDSYIRRLIPDFKNSEIVVTPDPIISAHAMRSTKELTDEVVLTLLASCGITVTLPSLDFAAKDEIKQFKEDYAEELSDYRIYLTNFVQQAKSELQSSHPSYKDVMSYGKRNFSLELKEKSKNIELVVEKAKKNHSQFVRKSLSQKAFSIGASMLKRDYIGAGQKLLEVLNSSRLEKQKYNTNVSRYHEAAYIYHIKNRVI